MCKSVFAFLLIALKNFIFVAVSPLSSQQQRQQKNFELTNSDRAHVHYFAVAALKTVAVTVAEVVSRN